MSTTSASHLHLSLCCFLLCFSMISSAATVAWNWDDVTLLWPNQKTATLWDITSSPWLHDDNATLRRNAAPTTGANLVLPRGVELDDDGAANLVLPRGVDDDELAVNNKGSIIIDELLSQVSATVAPTRTAPGVFTSIQTAINSAKPVPGKRYVIHVRQGTYKEYVTVPITLTNLVLIGDGVGRTIITGDHSNATGFTTFASATFSVFGRGFMAVGIQFENTAGPTHWQAVAVLNAADESVFYRCSFLGYQDTLCTHQNKQFYRDCQVYGTVDAIFGDAAAVFQNCDIFARRPVRGQPNVLTAQGRRSSATNTGISIHGCRILPAADLVPVLSTTQTYLGRPWKEYSTTVVMQSDIGGLIDRAGWLAFDKTFALDTLFYGEYDNHGAGAPVGGKGRVKWKGIHSNMTATEAKKFTVDAFISGSRWIHPKIPFTRGLLPPRQALIE